MASVTFEHLSKTYPNGFVSVDDVNLTIEDGEFVVFHGPSGCGKSTILRMIGGLEDITSGRIYLGNDLLNDILPRDRRLAMAFQNYTLYRHMNVYDNMALGLRLRDLPRTVIDSRVKSAAGFSVLPIYSQRRSGRSPTRSGSASLSDVLSSASPRSFSSTKTLRGRMMTAGVRCWTISSASTET